ncbi:hypothetical protein MVEN_01503000 [Mycena venus]|uniref:Uncharacterized protein n=1 Tax=Mycena venus TaxID=2733690 RepID=A0A8H7CRG0_9AGAR|nr:hypothetical protein MVEN_01503000 [Mycena venus]
MLIKLTPPPSPTPTPTILFALAFPDPPGNLPLSPAWAAQLARLAADDLEAPPALHALDRAAAFPSLLAEEWDLGPRCAEMLGRVIRDVEESGRAEERAREWQRAVEAERVRAEREVGEREREMERAMERMRAEREKEAELERDYEEKMQSMRAKGKGKEQSLNSPPAPLKGAARPKGRLHRSRSLLMALVASFSSPSSSPSSSSSPTTPASAPATRSSFSGNTPRSSSPLRAFARRASLSALSSKARTEGPLPDSPPPSPTSSRSRPTSPPSSPPSPPVQTYDSDPFQSLETPPSSAPPSAPSSAFTSQQVRARPRPEEMSPRALRRRARSTLVDAFRAHVLPELGARICLFEPSSSTASIHPHYAHLQLRVASPGAEDEGEYMLHIEAERERDDVRARGGGYHAWVTRSMLRRAEARMRELEREWPALASPTRSRHSHHSHGHGHHYEASASGGSDPLSPVSITFPTSPRTTTFEPWSSDESESESESDTDGEGGVEGDEDEDDSDGSSVHTPESGHSIGSGHKGKHGQEVSTSTTSSYFTCADDEDDTEGEGKPKPTVSHIRGGAHSSEHSRSGGGQRHGRNASERSAKKEQRERKRAERAARAEHIAFVRMTARLRRLLAHGAAARNVARAQRAEGDRVREGRGVRRAWLDKKGGTGAGVVPAQAFRPSVLRSVWDAEDAAAEAEAYEEAERPPAYEDVVLQLPMRRTRPSPPMHRAPVHKVLDELERDNADVELECDGLDDLDVVDLEHLDLSDALDIDGMALAVDGDLDDELGLGGAVDVFADVGSKGRARGRLVPVPLAKGKVQGLREVWERRRAAAAVA